MSKGAKYAIRPLYDEESTVSCGWQVIELLAETSDSTYGTKVGELSNDVMNVRSLAFVQFIIASLEEQERDRVGRAQESSGHDFGREPAIEGDIIRSSDT